MGASKEFSITDHEFVPCGCGDPECPYCSICKEQHCFHQPVIHGIRDVLIDEIFTWREEFGQKAKEAFGGHSVDVSPRTYGDIKRRCDALEREADPFFEHALSLLPEPPVPLNGIQIHMVKQGEVPDGVLRKCGCREKRIDQ
jgi:hypothetical protein